MPGRKPIEWVISIILAILFWLFFIHRNERDVRPYLFIDQQVIAAKEAGGVNDATAKSIKRTIDGMEIEAAIYLLKNQSMVIVINRPILSGWLISDLSGGKCFKLFGEGDPKGFLSETREVCKY